MDVNTAEDGRFQHWARQDQAIGCNHRDIGAECCKPKLINGIAQLCRRANDQP